ncbi:MAG: hypothetical protein QW275_03460 [Candidatus Anstonellaceae archaeon]
MKLLQILVFALFFGIINSDIIDPNTHDVRTFVRFVNLDEYPQASFYFVHEPIMEGSLPTRTPIYVSEWISLDQGYKFDSYYIVMSIPGKPELNASLTRYVSLPNTDPRKEIWTSYRVVYNQTAHHLLLEEVDNNSEVSLSNFISVAAVAMLLIVSAAAIWKIKSSRI